VRRLLIVMFFVGVFSFPAQADASLSGCRTVDVARVGRSPLGFVVYKFHHVKRWCWRFPRITYVHTYTYVSDVDAHTMRYRGLVAATGFYYRWCCSTRRSGHFSFRQARFSNCFWKLGCWRIDHPWVRIWVHADGTYAARTGV
jgi:hypothetical protein